MSSNPLAIRVKRKKDDPPLETLVLKRPKKQRTEQNAPEPEGHIRYQLQKQTQPAGTVNVTAIDNAAAVAATSHQRRVFHLADIHVPRGLQKSTIPTFVEATAITKRKVDEESLLGAPSSNQSRRSPSPYKRRSLSPTKHRSVSPVKRQYKRPSIRASSLRPASTLPKKEETQAERDATQKLADALETFAEEAQKEENNNNNNNTHIKPVVALPKLSAARARELHQQTLVDERRRTMRANSDNSGAVAQSHQEQHNADGPRRLSDTINGDVEMADVDTDFIYDTYMLDSEPPSSSPAPGTTSDPTIGEINIAPDEEAIWEAWAQQGEPGNDEVDNDDDEDSNAEDHYTADYPDEESDSEQEAEDDEYGPRFSDFHPDKYSKFRGEEDYPDAYSGDEEDYMEANPWRFAGRGQHAEYMDETEDEFAG